MSNASIWRECSNFIKIWKPKKKKKKKSDRPTLPCTECVRANKQLLLLLIVWPCLMPNLFIKTISDVILTLLAHQKKNPIRFSMADAGADVLAHTYSRNSSTLNCCAIMIISCICECHEYCKLVMSKACVQSVEIFLCADSNLIWV